MDKRYRLKYGNGVIENLLRLREEGPEAFEAYERKKWTCPSCGESLCIHHAECMHCGGPNLHFITNRKIENYEGE